MTSRGEAQRDRRGRVHDRGAVQQPRPPRGRTAAARLACEYDDLGIYGFALVELVEAAARTGDTEEAAAALRRLEERTDAVGTDWALGILAWSRALLSDGPSRGLPLPWRRSSGSSAVASPSISPARN